MSSGLEDALYALEVIYHDVSDSKVTKDYYEGLKTDLSKLFEQRAELLEACKEAYDALGGDDCFSTDEDVVEQLRRAIHSAAIANATQQRNATGGEG